ncbi:hypothetical protein LguiB_032673 [Lonicera macranthoides]
MGSSNVKDELGHLLVLVPRILARSENSGFSLSCTIYFGLGSFASPIQFHLGDLVRELNE